MTVDRSTCTATLHGDESAYRYGCRCDDAREDRRLKDKRRREGRHTPARVPQLGTSRRLGALAALGWSNGALAEHAGCKRSHVKDLRAIRRGGTVQRSTADLWAGIYDQLSGTPGGCQRAKTWAAKRGFVPPLLWEGIDIDNPDASPADDTPVRGPRVDLEEIAHLTSFGLTLAQAADRLGVEVGSIRTARMRARRKETGVAA